MNTGAGLLINNASVVFQASSMKHGAKRFLIYLGLALAGLALVLFGAITLLCWITPSVTLVNDTGAPLYRPTLYLPDNTLQFDDLAPGEQARVFYDAEQSAGRYQLEITLNGIRRQFTCGQLENGEWGKRMQMVVSGPQEINCFTQLRR